MILNLHPSYVLRGLIDCGTDLYNYVSTVLRKHFVNEQCSLSNYKENQVQAIKVQNTEFHAGLIIGDFRVWFVLQNTHKSRYFEEPSSA